MTEKEADGVPIAEAAAAAGVPVATLQQAAKRGLINAWTVGGVQYLSRAEAMVYARHRPDVTPALPEPWAGASKAIRERYAGAYIRLR